MIQRILILCLIISSCSSYKYYSTSDENFGQVYSRFNNEDSSLYVYSDTLPLIENIWSRQYHRGSYIKKNGKYQNVLYSEEDIQVRFETSGYTNSDDKITLTFLDSSQGPLGFTLWSIVNGKDSISFGDCFDGIDHFYDIPRSIFKEADQNELTLYNNVTFESYTVKFPKEKKFSEIKFILPHNFDYYSEHSKVFYHDLNKLELLNDNLQLEFSFDNLPYYLDLKEIRKPSKNLKRQFRSYFDE